MICGRFISQASIFHTHSAKNAAMKKVSTATTSPWTAHRSGQDIHHRCSACREAMTATAMPHRRKRAQPELVCQYLEIQAAVPMGRVLVSAEQAHEAFSHGAHLLGFEDRSEPQVAVVCDPAQGQGGTY